jgi:hypothetical protein
MPEFTQEKDAGLKPVTFVVMREGVDMIAVVSANVRDDLTDEVTFKARLTEVVTRWMLKSADGRAAAERTGFGFNIGDLPSFMSPSLFVMLTAAGIWNLDVQVVSAKQSGDWLYDDLLFDSDLVTP